MYLVVLGAGGVRIAAGTEYGTRELCKRQVRMYVQYPGAITRRRRAHSRPKLLPLAAQHLTEPQAHFLTRLRLCFCSLQSHPHHSFIYQFPTAYTIFITDFRTTQKRRRERLRIILNHGAYSCHPRTLVLVLCSLRRFPSYYANSSPIGR
jgi:hypothetical protein